jgi:hyperosmotically inducible periplasmic protein
MAPMRQQCAIAQTSRRRTRMVCPGPVSGAHRKEHSMKFKLAAILLATGAVLGSFAVQAATETGTDTDRSHPKTFMKDSVVTAKVKTHLAEQKFGSLARIHVDTHGHGAVVLTGTVHSQDQADKAASIARDTEGVTSVKSRIRIKAKST